MIENAQPRRDKSKPRSTEQSQQNPTTSVLASRRLLLFFLLSVSYFPLPFLSLLVVETPLLFLSLPRLSFVSIDRGASRLHPSSAAPCPSFRAAQFTVELFGF